MGDDGRPPGPRCGKMLRTTERAWWPAVGAPLERRVRPRAAVAEARCLACLDFDTEAALKIWEFSRLGLRRDLADLNRRQAEWIRNCAGRKRRETETATLLRSGRIWLTAMTFVIGVSSKGRVC